MDASIFVWFCLFNIGTESPCTATLPPPPSTLPARLIRSRQPKVNGKIHLLRVSLFCLLLYFSFLPSVFLFFLLSLSLFLSLSRGHSLLCFYLFCKWPHSRIWTTLIKLSSVSCFFIHSFIRFVDQTFVVCSTGLSVKARLWLGVLQEDK